MVVIQEKKKKTKNPCSGTLEPRGRARQVSPVKPCQKDEITYRPINVGEKNRRQIGDREKEKGRREKRGLDFREGEGVVAMNPLTLVKRIQNINSKEAALGISEEASWHAKYKDSAYVFVGGIPFDLTEGDLLAVFAQ